MSSTVLHVAAFCARILPAPFRRATYHLGPISHTVRRILNRVAPVGLTEIPIAAGPLAGTRLVLDLQSEKDLWLGTYEPDLHTAVATFVQPGMIAYDVGANIGYVSLLLVRRVGVEGRVFAFEPLPANLERLRRNLSLQADGARVSVVPMAVTDRPGRKQFLVHGSAGMGKVAGSAGRDDAYAETLEVETVSLDHFVFELGNPPPQVVKIDIEGGEVLAIGGMRRLLTEICPILLIELHGAQAADAVRQPLIHAGYTLHSMRAGFPVIPDLATLPWKAYVVALPPQAAAQVLR